MKIKVNSGYNDIETVRKYFSGELNNAEMHDLEAKALDDPFLKDAMDGFEDFPIQQQDITDLEERLAGRLIEKEKRKSIWGLKQWGIAASVIFGIALFSIYFNQTPENQPMAVNELQKKEHIPAPIIKEENNLEDSIVKENKKLESLADIVNESPTIVSNQSKNKPNKALRSYAPADEIVVESLMSADKIDSEALNDVIAVRYGAQNKTAIASSVAKIEERNDQAKKEKANNAPVAAAKADQIVALSKSRMSLVTTNTKSNVLKGRITDSDHNEPLPGVAIKDKETGIATQTDINGVFEIPVSNEAYLTVSYIGFETQSLSAKAQDSINILLKPELKALSESVIVGYGTTNKTSEEILGGPNGGWSQFRKYLDENAKLPNHVRARVNVEFIITANGTLTNFKIVKSYSKTADDKAVKLIKNYSGWHGSADGLPQKIKVAVRFK
ncbi:MAG: TonB family protein [Pelobium sp.]